MEAWIFCDLYDTLIDPARSEKLWPEAFGRLAAARWGGEAERWAAAHRTAEPEAAAALRAGVVAQAGRGTRQLWHRYFRELLARQFALAGVAVPPGLALAAVSRRLQAEVPSGFCAALPGAVAGVQALHAAGYRLAVAADLPAPLAAGILAGCGLTPAFAAVLGPDVLGLARISPEYYRRAFAAVRAEPGRCVVLTARPQARQWALAAGAAAALVPAEAGWAAVQGQIAALSAAWW